MRGATELGDDGNHRLAPGIAHVGFDRGQRDVERAQEIGELTRSRALVDVCVPPDKARSPDTWTVRFGEKARGSARGFRDIGAQTRNAKLRKLAGRQRVHSARASKGGKAHPRLKRNRKLRVGVLIEVK